MEFGRYAARNARKQGKKPATFNFLGFVVPPSFGISFFSHPHGLIRVLDEFVLNLFQKTLRSTFLDGFKRHPVAAAGGRSLFP